MSNAGNNQNLLNPSFNTNSRAITLQYVEVRGKTRNVDGTTIHQVGLFARSDLQQTIAENSILLEENPLIQYTESPEDEGDIDPLLFAIQSLTPEKKRIYDLLYCAPQLVNTGQDPDLGRWWTNRFHFKVHDKGHRYPGPQNVVEAVYQHSSAIDHSCMNWNAEAKLKPDNPDTQLQIIAKQDIRAGEEILLHYDWENCQDKRSGRRKEAQTIHSDLSTIRGFYCESCIFHCKAVTGLRRSSRTAVETDTRRRRVLQPKSPTAAFRQREFGSKTESCLRVDVE